MEASRSLKSFIAFLCSELVLFSMQGDIYRGVK